MNEHLTDLELDALLCGETLADGRAGHLQECLVCRHRRDAFLAAVAEVAGDDPGPDQRARVRQAALAQWRGAHHVVRWWLAAAAALLLAVVVPLAVHRPAAPQAVDTDAVLEQVDEVLARDPLTVMASEDVVEAVVPTQDVTKPEGSAS